MTITTAFRTLWIRIGQRIEPEAASIGNILRLPILLLSLQQLPLNGSLVLSLVFPLVLMTEAVAVPAIKPA
ncbi:hypothetical protein D3C74_481520 [compost metagenome]